MPLMTTMLPQRDFIATISNNLQRNELSRVSKTLKPVAGASIFTRNRKLIL
jgi:hypothetical protein